jgi:S1-C subfamily serine protease
MKVKHAIPVAVIVLAVGIALAAMLGLGAGDASWLGMTVTNLSVSEAAGNGIPTDGSRVAVVKVEKAALTSGIVVGDVLIGINGKPINSIATFLDAAQAAKNTRTPAGRIDDVVVTLRRFGQTVMVTIRSEVIEAYGSP